jgi:anti-sigma B factor antagonist
MTDFEQPLVITSGAHDGELVIRLVGELDPHTSPLLEQEIDDGLSSAPARLVLDMSELRFIDSSGLRVLIKAHKSLGAAGKELVLRAPNETAVRLFEITDLVDHFTIEEA